MSGAALVPVSPESVEERALFVVFQVDGVSYALPADAVVQMETYAGSA